MSNNIRIIGMLMTENECAELGLPNWYKRIFLDNNNQYMITLKPLCILPKKFKDVDKIVCWGDALNNQLNGKDSNEVEVLDMVENRIISFGLRQGQKDLIAFDPHFLPVNSNPQNIEESYVGVPCFDLEKLNISQSDFENIVEGSLKELPAVSTVSDDIEDRPNFIVVKTFDTRNSLYKNILYFNVRQYGITENSTYITIDIPSKSKILLDDRDLFNVIDIPEDNIMFLPKKMLDMYQEKIEEVKNNDTKQENSAYISKNNNQNMAEANNLSNPMGKDMQSKHNQFKNSYLFRMQRVASEKHLLYTNEDLINFYVSAQSSNFIVLAGMSGTGKSKLVKVYSKALGIDEYDGLKFISVSPAWTDDTDLLGYVDYKNMLYREADTELLTFLKEASKHRERKYVICLDEMNLARIEHYFSQFLSILEDDEDERVLVVYNKELESKLYNSSIYPSSIKLWDNVLFVGTVNIDESTFNFSDKVLDRANIIKLSMRPFIELRAILDDCKLTDRELAFLTEFHNLIKEFNPQLGIGYRIVKQINNYLKNIPKEISYSREDAFDKLIIQRIITKLRGSEEQLNKLIGRIDEDDNLNNSKIISLLDKYSDVSSFTNLRVELKNKAKELMLYGYSI